MMRRYNILVHSQPADQRTHAIASKLARRFVFIILAILKEHEQPEALRQAYMVARDGLEELRSKQGRRLRGRKGQGDYHR
jgi:hypothetical protein